MDPRHAVRCPSPLPVLLMSNAALLRETESFLYTQIPLTRAMGVRLERYDEAGLVLTAPLALNHNHLGTAFGGSLATAATLAGYTLLWLELGDCGSHIVIKESHLRYKAPVRGDIRAIAPRLPPDTLHRFRQTFAQNGTARLTLPITIVEPDGRICVEFTGTFVALR